MKSRRGYKVNLTVNRKKIRRVIIDPHYEEKHGDSIDDEIILELVKTLDKQEISAVDLDDEGFSYFIVDPVYYESNPYRLVWLLHEDDDFLGIINAFRR